MFARLPDTQANRFHSFRHLFLLVILIALNTGCGKKPNNNPPPPEPTDIYGYLPEDITFVYGRPGTSIRVDFVKALDGTVFTAAETALICKALDMLSAEEITKIHVFAPAYFPNAGPTHPLYVHYFPVDATIAIGFDKPANIRPLDPNLGTLVLEKLGFPGRQVIPSNQGSNPQTQEDVFSGIEPELAPRILPKVVPLLSTPARLLVVSPERPTQYTPIITGAGISAVFAEDSTGSGDFKQLTMDDQIRPHGGRTALMNSPGLKN